MIHDIDLVWQDCPELGCDYKAKENCSLTKHIKTSTRLKLINSLCEPDENKQMVRACERCAMSSEIVSRTAPSKPVGLIELRETAPAIHLDRSDNVLLFLDKGR